MSALKIYAQLRTTMYHKRFYAIAMLCTLTLQSPARCAPCMHRPFKQALHVGNSIIRNKYGRQFMASGACLFTAQVLSELAPEASNIYTRTTNAGGTLLLISAFTDIINDSIGSEITNFLKTMDGTIEWPVHNDEPVEEIPSCATSA